MSLLFLLIAFFPAAIICGAIGALIKSLSDIGNGWISIILMFFDLGLFIAILGHSYIVGKRNSAKIINTIDGWFSNHKKIRFLLYVVILSLSIMFGYKLWLFFSAKYIYPKNIIFTVLATLFNVFMVTYFFKLWYMFVDNAEDKEILKEVTYTDGFRSWTEQVSVIVNYGFIRGIIIIAVYLLNYSYILQPAFKLLTLKEIFNFDKPKVEQKVVSSQKSSASSTARKSATKKNKTKKKTASKAISSEIK